MRSISVMFTLGLLWAAGTQAASPSLVDDLKAQWAEIQGQIVSAQGDDNLLDGAYQAYGVWASQAVGFAELTSMRTQSISALNVAVYQAAMRAHEKCVSGPDAQQIAKIMKLRQWAQGKTELTGAIGSPESIEGFALKCARFELLFESRMSTQTPDGEIHLGVLAQYPLTPTIAGNQIQLNGSGPMDYSEITWPRMEECTITGSGGEVTLTSSGTMTLNLSPGSNEITAIDLGLLVPEDVEHLVLSCPNGTGNQDQHMWSIQWSLFHQEDMVKHPIAGGYPITDWNIGRGKNFARRMYQRNMDAKISEDTRMTLIHVPRK